MRQQVLFQLDEGNRNHPFGQETVFEPQRGIVKVELEEGYAQVTLPTNNIHEELESLSIKKVSFNYLKLLSNGISFIITEEDKSLWSFDNVVKGLSIMKVHAANLREEHGLVAHILEIAIKKGIEIHHISDIHNCLTVILNEQDAKKLCQEILKDNNEN